MSSAVTAHIEIDDDGVAWIDDTNVKVIEVAVDKLAHGSSPEEMHFQYPHLSLAQIHAALAYYYDHQNELDAEIRKRWAEANELASRASDVELRQRLVNLKNAAEKQMSARSYHRRKTGAATRLRQIDRLSLRSYRRRAGRDTWHWCKNCSFWPTSDYEERKVADFSSGELCNECRAKEANGNCHGWA